MTNDIVVIHVRFANDGSVAEISERPASLSAQQWFDALSEAAPPDMYRALAGGRGMFRLSKEQLESHRAKVSGAAAA